MAVSTHVPNSTVPDCRMRVPRRRKISTAQSWRFVPDAILPGHRRAHWWVPAWTPTVHQCPHSGKAVGGSTAHTSTWHRSTQQTRMNPKQIHEVTNTDSVIRAHGSGACHGHTADNKIADRRSVLWRLHHERLDVRLAVVVAACCKVPEHGLDDNEVANVSQEWGHRERRAVNRDGVPHQVEPHVRCGHRARRHSPPRALCTTMDKGKLDGIAGLHGWKAQKSRES